MIFIKVSLSATRNPKTGYNKKIGVNYITNLLFSAQMMNLNKSNLNTMFDRLFYDVNRQ